MKKLLFAIGVLILGGLGVALLSMGGKVPGLAEKQNAAETKSGVDYAAIYALHDPDEVVMIVDGREVTWDEYYYFYYSQVRDMEEQFAMLQYYGVSQGWNTPTGREDGSVYADLVAEGAEAKLLKLHAVEDLAAESGIQLTPEEEDALMQEHQQNIAYFCGENGTEDQLWEELKDMYMSKDMYWRYLRALMLQESYYMQKIGENGEHLTDQEVLDWMDSYDILSVDRIKLMGQHPDEEAADGETTDDAQPENGENEPENGEEAPENDEIEEEPVEIPQDQAEVTQPERDEPEGEVGYEMGDLPVENPAELAQEIASQLQAVADPEERAALFLELKARYSADDVSYVSLPRRIDQPIAEIAQKLEPGQVSDPVEIDGDYYVILRRPLSAEDLIDTGYGKEPARSLAASDIFGLRLTEKCDNMKVEYVNGFVPPRVMDYYTAPAYAR